METSEKPLALVMKVSHQLVKRYRNLRDVFWDLRGPMFNFETGQDYELLLEGNPIMSFHSCQEFRDMLKCLFD